MSFIKITIFPSLPLTCDELLTISRVTKALICATMLKAQLRLHWCSSSWTAGPLRAHSGSQTEGRIPQRVSGLSHDSMCGRPWSPLC